jgi:chromosome segregation ATPase
MSLLTDSGRRAFRATLRDASRLLAELRQDLQRTRQKAPGGRVAAAAALAAEIASLKAANSSLSEKVLKSEREREELRETVESERKRADEAEKKRKSAVEELESIRADPELFLAGMRLPCRAVAVKPPAEDDDFDPES